MGTCFGCCPVRNRQRKMPKSNIFLRSPKDLVDFQDDQEVFELERRDTNANRKQANSVSAEIVPSGVPKPSKLTLKKNHFCWLGKDNLVLSGAIGESGGFRSPTDAMIPLLQGDGSLADSCSVTGSQRWEQIGTTPGSSVDLEWENEIGLTPPANICLPDELTWNPMTETTNTSWRSSPVSLSNGLEWDGDFVSVEVSDIVLETQKLISDIDQIAAKTLTETDSNR